MGLGSHGASRPADAGATQPRAAAVPVSVCIPTRDRLPLLRQTLAALDAQTEPASFQVIVADDGSRDGTVAELAQLRPGFDLRWVQSGGRGSGAARNLAARAAEGEILLFLDDDQVALPGLVAAHLAAHREHGPVLVQGPYPLAPGWDRAGASLVYDQTQAATMAQPVNQSALARHLWGANISVSAATWRAVGGFDESLLRNQDLDFGIRVAALGVPLRFEPEAMSYHLHHVNAASFGRLEFRGGQDLVSIASKHGLPLAAVVGPQDGLQDRLAATVWRRSPAAARAAGSLLTGLLRAADASGWRRAQLTTARKVARFYLIGGISAAGGQTTEPSRGSG